MLQSQPEKDHYVDTVATTRHTFSTSATYPDQCSRETNNQQIHSDYTMQKQSQEVPSKPKRDCCWYITTRQSTPCRSNETAAVGTEGCILESPGPQEHNPMDARQGSTAPVSMCKVPNRP
jgi:hypothetical protein